MPTHINGSGEQFVCDCLFLRPLQVKVFAGLNRDYETRNSSTRTKIIVVRCFTNKFTNIASEMSPLCRTRDGRYHCAHVASTPTDFISLQFCLCRYIHCVLPLKFVFYMIIFITTSYNIFSFPLLRLRVFID